MIRIGPAGWSYPDWEGRVYPRHKPRGFHPLRYLARYLDCIEVNSTFYALPRAEHAARWCELVRDRPDFRFVVKLLSEFTHAPEPEDERAWPERAASFLAGIEPLRRRRVLSALLVQFPAGFRAGEGAVRRLGRLRALFGELPLVLELRHRSWFEPPRLDAVRGLGYSLAHIDLPAAWDHPPDWHPPTGPIGYLRLHGRNARQWFRSGAGRDDRYDYLYGPEELRELAAKARRIARASEETYVVTNNHFAGQAVANALELRALLAGERPVAPRELLASFPRLAQTTREEGQAELFE